jgi:glycosyltransferase involved in cell wall biosynthesis
VNDRPTIVSLTPLAVRSDSRTYKQAASVARLGYRSIVIEGESSGFPVGVGLPFELRSVRPPGSIPTTVPDEVLEPSRRPIDGPTSPPSQSRLRRIARAVLHGVRRRLALLPDAVKAPLRVPAEIGYTFASYLYDDVFAPLAIAPKAALYYLHSPRQFPAVYVLSRRYRVPFVYDAHDFYPSLEPDERRWTQRYLFRPFMNAIERLCVRAADAVITVNPSVAALLRQHFGCESVILRNSHDPRLDRRPAEGLRDRLGLPADAFILVCVGHGKPGQALEESLQALAMLPDRVHLVFLGRNYEPQLVTAERLGLKHRVHHIPPVDPAEVVPFIASADATLILYYARSIGYEVSLPNRFFQAVAAGLPVLYPDLPEIRLLSKRLGLGLPIDVRAPDSIVRSVRQLLDEPGLRAALRAQVVAAQAELTWEHEERELARLLAKVTGLTPTASLAAPDAALLR